MQQYLTELRPSRWNRVQRGMGGGTHHLPPPVTHWLQKHTSTGTVVFGRERPQHAATTATGYTASTRLDPWGRGHGGGGGVSDRGGEGGEQRETEIAGFFYKFQPATTGLPRTSHAVGRQAKLMALTPLPSPN